jgi:hypothetical protein
MVIPARLEHLWCLVVPAGLERLMLIPEYLECPENLENLGVPEFLGLLWFQ